MTSGQNIPPILTITASFIWVGMVIGISFIESWLKFQAPGVTIDIGVGIGKLVFDALNKVEIGLAVVILVSWWKYKDGRLDDIGNLAMGIVVVILLIQSIILLPAMDSRADMRLTGQMTEPSYLHIYYVVGEIIKITGLIIFGTKNIERFQLKY